jgi:hypothetical protein
VMWPHPQTLCIVFFKRFVFKLQTWRSKDGAFSRREALSALELQLEPGICKAYKRQMQYRGHTGAI